MRIGVDVTPLQSSLTGIGNYVYYLLNELISLRRHDMFYLYSIRSSKILESLATNSNTHLRQCSLLGKSEALWSQTTLAWMCFKDSIDLFWGSTQSLPLAARKKQKNILTIYDFAYMLYPETVSLVRGTYLRFFAKHFYKKADCRIAISAGTGSRLKELYSMNADAIVIPPLKKCASDPSALQEYHLMDKGYYLMVGTLEPRKNVVNALKAYCELLGKVNLAPLVLAGKQGWRNREMVEEIENMHRKHPDHIKLLGYVPDSKLHALVQAAKAYIMPSIYEGYGMPIAEARSLGTPVICCRIPEMVEAAEGDALFVDLKHFHKQFQEMLLHEPSPPKKATYPSTRKLVSLISQQIDHLT